LNLLSDTLSRKSAVITAHPLALRLLHGSELEDAAQLVGRGMRDNPANMRVFRIPDGEHRSIAMGRFFVPVLRGLFQRGLVLGAILSDRLVGICGMARPGFCQPNTIEKSRALPAAMIGNPITTALLILNWVKEWSRHDPSEPHWHLGPVAVEPSLQGQGIGSAMLNAFCAVVDSTGAHAYLETDKPENVRLYQRFGFRVLESAQVLGVPNWFMSRAATKTLDKAVGRGGGLEESRVLRDASEIVSGHTSGAALGRQHETGPNKP
jgi:GNAT superfamily N-acetyltransferase